MHTVVLSRQVHHREIFVIELTVLLGRVAVSLHQMLVHVPIGDHVPIHVHGHEAGQLQETRIHITPEPRIGRWHLVDAVLLEPVHTALLG